jgi:TIGR03009 family protein
MRQGRGLVLLGLGLLALLAPLSVYGQDYGPLRDQRMPPPDQQRSVYDSSQGQSSSPPLYNQPQPPNNGAPSDQRNGPPAPEQYNQPQPPNNGPGGYGPPPDPRLERVGPPSGPNRQAGLPPVPPGFQLSREEQDDLDRLLTAWEQRGRAIKSFECSFTRMFYNRVWNNGDHQGPNNADKPVTVLRGELKYSAPDKGLFVIHPSSPTEPETADKWICDGRSIFRYDFHEHRVVEYPLPPELHGKEITNGPLPFLFGAEASRLKQRYFLKIIPPPAGQGGQQVWLVARPRFREDAQNFSAAEMILKVPNLEPIAIRLYSPNPNIWTVYAFDPPKINAIDPRWIIRPLRILQSDPFTPDIPSGWTRELDREAAAAAQAARPNQARPR